MDKETKQLNTLLAAVAVIGITVPFMHANAERQMQAVQINVDQMEVTQEIYRAIYTASLSCDLEVEVREALRNDNKITYTEATGMGEKCEADILQHATQPFERGMLEQELNYSRNGGLSM